MSEQNLESPENRDHRLNLERLNDQVVSAYWRYMRNYPMSAPLLLGVKDSLEGDDVYDETPILVRFLDNAKQQTLNAIREIRDDFARAKARQEAGWVCCPTCTEKQAKCDEEDCCTRTGEDEDEDITDDEEQDESANGDENEFDWEEISPAVEGDDDEDEDWGNLSEDVITETGGRTGREKFHDQNLSRLKAQVEKAYWEYVKDYTDEIPRLGTKSLAYEYNVDSQEESIMYDFLENARLQSRNTYDGVEEDVAAAQQAVLDAEEVKNLLIFESAADEEEGNYS